MKSGRRIQYRFMLMPKKNCSMMVALWPLLLYQLLLMETKKEQTLHMSTFGCFYENYEPKGHGIRFGIELNT